MQERDSKMNIYIYNCPNTFNYGSMMMGENFISYFNNVTGKKNNYYVETMDEVNIERLRNATNIKEIYSVKMNSLFKKDLSKYDYILSYYKVKRVISDFVNKIDLVVVLGGDDFTEDYGWKVPLMNAIKFNILKNEGLIVVMLGQTMGPYHLFRKPAMKHLLNKIDKIYTRENITYNYLKNLGLNNAYIMDDLALLPLSRQEIKERTKEYITYCPSELIYRYSKTAKREDWVEFNLFMLKVLMERYPDKKIVLLAHVLRPEHVDDRKTVKELYNSLEDKYKDRIVVENNEMYPYEVRNYIQRSLFTISSRMHPVISSIQCEIPAIAISYSTKYWGIIGERYDLSDYILDVRYLNYDEMKERFIYLLDKIDNESPNIQNKMKEKNQLANESIIQALKDIANIGL